MLNPVSAGITFASDSSFSYCNRDLRAVSSFFLPLFTFINLLLARMLLTSGLVCVALAELYLVFNLNWSSGDTRVKLFGIIMLSVFWVSLTKLSTYG